jgi:N-acetylglucosamine-6-phosphate deacetylase
VQTTCARYEELLDGIVVVRNVELPLETALAMVTSIPARAMGLDAEYGRLAANARANILLLDARQLQAQRLILEGLLRPRT